MESQEPQQRHTGQGKLYAVRTVAGRELDVALIVESRVESSDLPIYSILVLPRVKGYIILESPAAHYVANAIQGIRYARGVVPGVLRFEDVERLLRPEAIATTLKPGEIVEIVSGPFRGLKAQVVRVDASRNEVVLNVLEAAYQLQITVPGDSVRPVKEESR
ncbi:MAG: transcription elongation factor Spt5 [Pyrodictiaceae archaeon]